MGGLRPIVEFMTWNFAVLAFDHCQSCSKVHSMSAGQFSVLSCLEVVQVRLDSLVNNIHRHSNRGWPMYGSEGCIHFKPI